MNTLRCLLLITFLMEVSSKQILDRGAHIKKRKRYVNPPLPPAVAAIPTPAIPTPPNSMQYALLNGSKVPDCPVNRIKRSVLTNQQLAQILHKKGGVINPKFMALTEDDARKHFTNLLPLPTVSSRTNALSEEQIVTKEQIYQDLKKWNYYLKMLVLSHEVFNRYTSNERQHQLNVTVTEFFKNRKRPLNFVSKSLLHEFGEHLLRSDNISVIGNAITDSGVRTHPSVLQNLVAMGRRSRRQSGGGFIKLQYCINKGVQQPDGFLPLCSSCAITRTLGSDKFPRIINEVICSGSDRTCLNVQHTPHGACKETSLQFDFLQIVPRGCKMMTQEKGVEIVHEWEKYTEKVRTGCTCAINKVSRLVQSFFPQFGR